MCGAGKRSSTTTGTQLLCAHQQQQESLEPKSTLEMQGWLKIICQWAERLGRLQSASVLWLSCSAGHSHMGWSWSIFTHTFKCPDVYYEVMSHILHWSLLDVKSAWPASTCSGQTPVPESCRDAPVLSNNTAHRANVVCLMSSKITRHLEIYAKEMLGFDMIIFSWKSHWTFILVMYNSEWEFNLKGTPCVCS